MKSGLDNGYAICSNKWALDKRIKNELGLLLIISGLCAKEGFCFASNTYFAELFDISPVLICRKIKKLESLGYISIAYEKKGCEVLKREIRLTEKLTDDLQKSKSTINEKVKDNNTSIKITSIKKEKEINKEKEEKTEKEKFNEFFKTYPKQEDEIKVFTQYSTLIKNEIVTHNELLEGAKRYRNYVTRAGTNPQYIKKPFNWLKDFSWNNEYETEERKPTYAEVKNLPYTGFA